MPFWIHKEEDDITVSNASAVASTDLSMDYTSDMVDVLDTIGRYLHYSGHHLIDLLETNQ